MHARRPATGLAAAGQVSCVAVTAALFACLLVLVALGLWERAARDRAWRAVPIRVHVNGSRGKSTVTRLICAALREAGIPVLGKTTGTAARLLLPDGTERALTRRAPASIREQLALLRRARRLHARALVAECMALDPELQAISERGMVNAGVGVITNVRLDHTEIMGGDLQTIAATLANTMPRGGVLVVGDDGFLPLFRARAAALGTRVIPASGARRDIESSTVPPWLVEDMATALAVTRHLGIPDETALRGFALAPPDPGAARRGTLHLDGRPIHWLDATAANDPESLLALTSGDSPTPGDVKAAQAPRLVVYNHRADRSARLACFAQHSGMIAAAERLLVTGARPPWTVWRELRRARGGRSTAFITAPALTEHICRQPSGTLVIFCGNTRGLDLARLFQELGCGG